MASKRVWPDIAIPAGETLAEELEARGLSQTELARQMRRPVQAINEIVRGRKAITAETALQLEDALGVSADFWLRLEADYQLNTARLARDRARGRRRALARA
jgi:HTH-type transcriptional regulator/antitoxin HigA